MQNLLFDYIEQYVTLSQEEKDAMTALDIFRSVKKGDILVKEGDVSREEYFVLKGCLRTFYVIDGEEKTTAFYTELEGVSPSSVHTGEPSDYYIAAVEDSIITVSDPDIDDDMMARFPKFEKMCRIISEELLVKEKIDFDKFKTSSPEQRYLNLLQIRPDLLRRVPQHQLASYLGITPQSLSRLRARILEKERS